MTPRQEAQWLRGSLVAVWLITAGVSVLEADGQSAALLAQAGVHSPRVASFLLWGGVAFDLAVALLLWRRPGRSSATVALGATLLLTAITTAVLPAMWLHPLGPLSKNLPILAALLVLRGRES